MPKYLDDTKRKKEIEKKYKEIVKDYDIEGMKANDIFMLKQLAYLMLQMDDLEKQLYEASQEGNLELYKKLQDLASSVRKDIISYQDRLGITRKNRQATEESSVAEFIKDLKKRASKLYDREMIYLYCPETNKLLATCWVANKKGQHKVNIFCPHCNKYHFFNPGTLARKKKRNSSDNVPEGL